MYQSEEILEQRFKEQIDTYKFKSLSTMEKFTIIDKFFNENSELFADIFVKNLTKDLVSVKDLAVGDRNIFYVEGLEDVNQEDRQEE